MISLFFSMDTYLEYCHRETKAMVEFLCEYLDVPLKNTVAAGDERNDNDLEEAHIGVTVKNAKRVKWRCADYVTQHTNSELESQK